MGRRVTCCECCVAFPLYTGQAKKGERANIQLRLVLLLGGKPAVKKRDHKKNRRSTMNCNNFTRNGFNVNGTIKPDREKI